MADQTVDPVVSAASAAAAPEAIPAPAPIATEIPPSSVTQHEDAAAPAHPDQVSATPKADAQPTSADASAKAAKTEEGFKPTLLEKTEPPKEEAKVEVKPEEAKPADVEAAKVETEEVKTDLPAIDYWAGDTAIKLPDTLKMDDAQRGEFAAALDTFRADPATGAQSIIDMGVKVITDYTENYRRGQWTTFNDTKEQWRNQIMADPVMGGAGHETAKALMGEGRDRLISSHKLGTPGYEKDVAEYNEFCRITGAGDHPVLFRLMHRAGKLFTEAAPPPPNPRPTADNGRRPGGKRDIYSNTKFPGQP